MRPCPQALKLWLYLPNQAVAIEAEGKTAVRYRRIHDLDDGIFVCAQSGEETGTHGAVDDAERSVASSNQPIEGPAVKGAKPPDETEPQGHARREP